MTGPRFLPFERPVDWEAVDAKWLFEETFFKGHPSEPPLSASQAFGVVPQEYLESMLERQVMSATKGLENFKLVMPDDFVISLRSFEGGLEHSRYRGIISPAYSVVRPRDARVCPGFFRHYLKSHELISRLQVVATGIRDGKTVRYDMFAELQLPLPPKSAQIAIARFLDDKTNSIDCLVAKKQRQLELLEEKRTALITNAVSKGLDPNVKTKHSGVEWLGKVPEHWRVASAKWVYEIQLGKMLQNQPNCPSDKAVPYLKAVHVNWGSVSNDELPTMWATLSDVNSHGVRQGDLLVCEGGEPGRAGIVGTVPDGCIMQNSLHRVRAENQYDLVFLLYVLWKANKCGYLETECNKATITHFTGEKFGNLRIPWPPGNERGLIADFLDNETNRINDLKDKIQESIDTLQEYRSALISAAVTGQIDVREEVV